MGQGTNEITKIASEHSRSSRKRGTKLYSLEVSVCEEKRGAKQRADKDAHLKHNVHEAWREERSDEALRSDSAAHVQLFCDSPRSLPSLSPSRRQHRSNVTNISSLATRLACRRANSRPSWPPATIQAAAAAIVASYTLSRGC